jgi:hypothetical protein
MKVKIIKAETDEGINAVIKKGKASELPSIQQCWRFNFDKELRKLKNASGYLLVTEETPLVIEGCMILQLIDKKALYMAFVEFAPHNKYQGKIYDHVAGCLIAFTYQLSVIEGVGDFKGMLQFDVMEQNKEDQIKLMAVYSTKYYAKRFIGTTMVIMDEDGEKLVSKYLYR